MVLVKTWKFFHIVLKEKIVETNVFYDILERRNASLGYKKKKFKKSKNCDFSKGVSKYSVAQKLVIFPHFFRKKK